MNNEKGVPAGESAGRPALCREMLDCKTPPRCVLLGPLSLASCWAVIESVGKLFP
jgi:hypothetical protein